MTLQEIFDQLTYGELSMLSIGGGEEGVIDETNYSRVLAHVNMGLTDLYKRFPLKEGRVTLALLSDKTEYSLDSKFALANTRSRELVRYLVDSATTPFKDDILKIERVLTDSEKEMELNNPSSEYSAFTPTSTTLRLHKDVASGVYGLPEWLKTRNLVIVYRANHPKIVKGLTLFDPTKVQIQLPESHLNALLLFVASRAHTPGGMTGEFNAGNNYAMKYEGECAQLETAGLRTDQGGGVNQRFHRRGWA